MLSAAPTTPPGGNSVGFCADAEPPVEDVEFEVAVEVEPAALVPLGAFPPVAAPDAGLVVACGAVGGDQVVIVAFRSVRIR
jgi:hypothetical protein